MTSLAARPTEPVREMLPKEPNLLKLNSWYRDYATHYGIHSYAFYETIDTFGIRVVDSASADSAIQGLAATPVDANHIDIAKPSERRAPLYVETVAFLEDVLGGLGKGDQTRTGTSFVRERHDDRDVSPQDRFGYRQIRENVLPALADFTVEARQGSDETRISAAATLECQRAIKRIDGDLGLWLTVESILMALHAEGGEVLASHDLSHDESVGPYRIVRESFDRIAISPNDSAPWLVRQVLGDFQLPEVRAFPGHPCSLQVQLSVFPEDIEVEPVDGQGNELSAASTILRQRLAKIVLSKGLDRSPIEHEQFDRIDDQLILSRGHLSWLSAPNPVFGVADATHAIDWKAIARVFSHPSADFTELVELAGLDRKIDFVKADLRFVDFGGSDLTGSNFEGSNLMGADLRRAKTDGANWKGIKGTPTWRAAAAAAEEHEAYHPEPTTTPGHYQFAEDQAHFKHEPSSLGDLASAPAGWTWIDKAWLVDQRQPLGDDELGRFFDGVLPHWRSCAVRQDPQA